MRIFFAALLMALGADIMVAATIWYVALSIEGRRAGSECPSSDRAELGVLAHDSDRRDSD